MMQLSVTQDPGVTPQVNADLPRQPWMEEFGVSYLCLRNNSALSRKTHSIKERSSDVILQM